MTAVAAPVECSADRALSSSSLATLYAADIYALQHRLSRCLHTVAPLLSSTPPSAGTSAKISAKCQETAQHIRRLGELLRDAKVLISNLTAQEASNEPSPSPQQSPAVEDTMADASLRAFYDQQLQTRLAQLQQDMVTAERLLRVYLSSTPGLRGLPVSCIGTTPRQLHLSQEGTSAQPCYVFTDALTPAAARLPAPTLHHVAGALQEERSPIPPTKEQPVVQQSTDNKSGKGDVASYDGVVAAAPPPPSAEDRIMTDIQQAIHQMKDGALQMRAMMAQEKTQMQSAADLLSSGVAKTHVNMSELDRVSGVAAFSSVPWIISFVPGMPILWRTVLQPIWAMVKQVLLMAAILAITGCVLLLIVALPKPVLLKGRHKIAAAPPTSGTAPPAVPPPLSEPVWQPSRDVPIPAAATTAPLSSERYYSPPLTDAVQEEEQRVWAERDTTFEHSIPNDSSSDDADL